MKYTYPRPEFRNSRTFVASLLAFLLLASQLAPLASAQATRSGARGQQPEKAKGAEPGKGERGGDQKVNPVLNAPEVVTIVATKTDNVPQATMVPPGATINYTVTVTNNGTTPATGVTFTDTVDANTTLVPGSVSTQPIANPDAFNVIGNVRIQPNSTQGLLANDCDPDNGLVCSSAGLTASGPTSTAQGGNLTVNANGSFTYNPAAGFNGTDTFTYTVTDGQGKTDTATATLTVSAPVWFVDDSAAPNGDGRLTNPFNCYTGATVPATGPTCFSATAADEAGDAIFLYDGSYAGGYALLANQKLVGQGASATLAAVHGVTVEPYSDALPATDGTPAEVAITTAIAATNAVPVSAGGITLRGFTVGATTGAKIFGTAFGTLTAGNNTTPDLTLSGAGQAINLTTGTFAATSGFTGVATTSAAGAAGITLTTVGGTVSFGPTTVTGAGAQGINISGSAVNATFGTTSVGAAAQGILVGTSTGNITFGGTTVTGGTDAVSLTNNSAGARTFASLTTSGNTGAGFLHSTGGGATTVTGATTIASPGGTGISINGSNANISFGATSVDKGSTAGTCVSIVNGATRTTTFASLDLNSTNAAGVGLFSTTGGNINVTSAAGSEITAPQLIDINVATLGLNFTQLASTNGPAATPAVRVIGAGGALVSGATNLQNPGNAGISLDGNSATFNFSNTTVSGSAGTGVFLNNNTAAVSFADLDINPDSGARAFHATDNNAATAAGTITTTSGDVQATGNVTLEIVGASTAARTPLAMVLNNLDSTNSSGNGVDLNFVSGSLTVNDATLPTNIVNAGNGVANTGVGIRVQNTAGGTMNFGNTVVSGSGSTGVFLSNNLGAVAFADLDINPDANQRALHATDTDAATAAGAISATSGTIVTTNGAAGGNNVAVEIAGASAAARTPISLVFNTVSANNALNGIVLLNTSDGGSAFRTLGTGSTDGSGGVITNITNRGASFVNADDIALNNMTFTTVGTANGADPTSAASTCGDLGPANGGNAGCNAGVHFDNVIGASLTNIDLNGGNQVGINGTSVTNFTLTNSNVLNFGDQVREDGLKFRNMLGTSSVTGTTVSGNEAVQVHVENTSGTLTSLTVSNTTISTSAAPNGSHGILFDTWATATGKLVVQGVTFSNLFSNCIDALSESSSGGMDVVVNGDPTGAALRNSFTGCGASGITIAQNGAAPVRFNIFNNGTLASPTFLGGTSSHAININQAGSAPQTAVLQGAITGNFIGGAGATSSTVGGDGITAATVAPGTLTVAINNNRVRGTGANGIRVQMREETNAAQRLNLTLLNNDVVVSNNPNGFDGIHAVAGTLTGDAGTMCAEINNNDASTIASGNDFVVRQRFLTTYQLRGYTGLNNNNAAVQTHLDVSQANDPVGAGLDWFISNNVAGGAGGFVNTPGGAQCAQPTLPSAPASIESADTGSDSAAARSQVSAAPAQVFAPMFAPLMYAPHVGDPVMPAASQTATAAAAAALTAKPDKTTDGKPAGKDTSLEKAEKPPTKRVINAVQSGETVTVNIGQLAAGDSVQITFSVTVNNPFPLINPSQVSNQGTVSGSNFANVLTDDPDAVGAANPTVTLVLGPPDVSIKDASTNEPPSGSRDMTFTVALEHAYTSNVSVNFATAAGGANPATAGTDYTTTSGTLTFTPGQLVQTVSVPVLADADASETDETFLVNLSAPVNAVIADGQATGTITAAHVPGTVLISELRTSGPGGLEDDFVELYNNTDAAIVVPAGGWGLFKMGAACSDTPVLIATVPAATNLPARGHYLITGSAYSLANYGGTGATAGDLSFAVPLGEDRNVGLFSTADVLQLSSGTRLDAVGFGTNTGNNCDLLSEGTNLAAAAGSASQHSFVRNQTTGRPLDRNDNAGDFLLVSTDAGLINGTQSELGGPGPERSTSPVNRSFSIKASLVDVCVASSAPPNRVRDLTAGDPLTSSAGTITIRRKFTNLTGGDVTRLRFRIIDVTTTPTAPGEADLRALTSSDVMVTLNPACGGGSVLVRGTTLETPPAQPNGGGWNSTLSAGTIALATPLAAGASINVQFQLGVQQTGTFRFFVIVEASPGGPPFAPGKALGDTSTKGADREAGKDVPQE